MSSVRSDPIKPFLKRCKASLIIPKTVADNEKLLNEPHMYHSINTRKQFFHGENVMMFLVLHSNEAYQKEDIDFEEIPKDLGNIKKKRSLISEEQVPFLIKDKFEQLYHFMESRILEEDEEKDNNTKNSSTLSHWSLNDYKEQAAILLPINKYAELFEQQEHSNTTKSNINNACFLIHNPKLKDNYYQYFIADNTYACLFKFNIHINSKSIFNQQSLNLNLGILIGKLNLPQRRTQFNWTLSSNYFLNHTNNSHSSPTTPNLTLTNQTNYYDNGILFGNYDYDNTLSKQSLLPGIYLKHTISILPQLKVNIISNLQVNVDEYLIKLKIQNIIKITKSVLIRGIKLRSNNGSFTCSNQLLPCTLNSLEELSIIYNYKLNSNNDNTNLLASPINHSFDINNNKDNNDHEIEVELWVSNYQYNNKFNQIRYRLLLNINNYINMKKVSLNPLISHSSTTSLDTSLSSVSSKYNAQLNAPILSISGCNKLQPAFSNSNKQIILSPSLTQSSIASNLMDKLIISFDTNFHSVNVGDTILLKFIIFNDGKRVRNLTVLVNEEPLIPKSPLNTPYKRIQSQAQHVTNHNRKKSLFLYQQKYFNIHEPFLNNNNCKDLNDYYYTNIKSYWFTKTSFDLPSILPNNCYQFNLNWLKWHACFTKLPMLHIVDKDFNLVYTVGEI